ncbi:FAD/NAD(P)-binding domain-containing protein [Lindgomyces ingoldianus]|uniref:FAD/NAD(P)-binding domain-containing protein n=1 Tax=Lindgomyces ingoldianus TaxID=673940 RepID=A0ACB6R6Z3_9PLEO|nr:FAD/NAD(P)-binding domain-containing protein [Lindgomyces ingoldianus]KAF2475014.1 FAD/NAD(P)-binding domain-containing protein [Lindgomyces ingoldianus]
MTTDIATNSSSSLNIAIIGAGIGGLGFAIGLSHLSIPFTIYESAPAFSAVGAGVGLGPNALRAMDLIDTHFRDAYMNIATGNLRPEKRHVMMEAMRMEEGFGEGEDWFGNGRGEWGGRGFERTGAHRKDLLDIMTGFIDGEKVRFRKRVVRMTQRDGEVTLTFDDGDIAVHDAVVACDGVKGSSRRVVLGDRFPEAVEPVYTGKYVYRAILPMQDAKSILGDLATDAKMFMAKDANVSTYPISEGREMNVVAFKRDEGEWRGKEFTVEVEREEMYAQPLRWGIFHHPHTPTYYSSLICLLGDVAHASGPHQGAGAGQCLEDALILSRVLGKLVSSTPSNILTPSSPDQKLERARIIKVAFQAYDEIRRPRAQEQVRTTNECGEIYNLRLGEEIPDRDGDGDIVAAVRNLKGRFRWIWEHDLEGDVRKVESRWGDGGEAARKEKEMRVNGGVKVGSGNRVHEVAR